MTFVASARNHGYQISAPPIRRSSGLVYRATDLETGRPVAVQVLAVGFDLVRLEREARILAQIDHENVAKVRDFVDIDGKACLIVDWVEGRTLSSLVGRTRELRFKRALDIFEQVASGLDAVHRAGVVHRDVTPLNIVIGPDDRATVVDFGLCQGTETAASTVDGTVLGTPRYLAPEVVAGDEATPKSDQYSLAVILYEMVTGRWPFPESGAVAGALHHQLRSPPKPADDINPLLGAGLTDALLLAMRKAPEKRFPSIEAFVAAVRDPRAQDLRRRRRIMSNPLVTVGVPLLLVTVLGYVMISTLGSNDRSPDELAASDHGGLGQVLDPWPAGTAADLECNLLTDVSFEGPLQSRNFFTNGEEPGLVEFELAADGGVDGTGSMQLGVAGEGQWGETVPVSPGNHYLFSAHTALDGQVLEAEMSVYWLDATYTWFDQTEVVDVVRTGNGQLLMETGPAPPRARFAVPRLYKGGANGVMAADELIFADVASDCGRFLLD